MREWIKRFEALSTVGLDIETSEELVGKLFEERRYKADFHVTPAPKPNAYTLLVNGHDVGLQYEAQANGTFAVQIYREERGPGGSALQNRQDEYSFCTRERAEQMLILAFDASCGPFDRAHGVDREIYVPPANELATGMHTMRRFATTEDIQGVYVVSGVREVIADGRPGISLEDVYENVTLVAGTEVLISASGLFAIANGQLREIAFEMPTELTLSKQMGKDRDQGVAFPTSRVEERPVTDEFREALRALERPRFDRESADAPLVVLGGLFGHSRRGITHEEDRMSVTAWGD